MALKENENRVSVYIDKQILKLVDASCELADCRNRNQFVRKAVEFYLGHLLEEETSRYQNTALSTIIHGTVDSAQQKTSRTLFKLAVEMCMLMHLTAAAFEFPEENLERLRGRCVDEVKKSIGAVNMSEITRYQNDK